jgi:site-specific DNA-methyltransferase (adenine-specific)|tara:strand:- start:9356 stop:9958 length:603 start_codon:yes stop_codon:yes gene_type:complete
MDIEKVEKPAAAEWVGIEELIEWDLNPRLNNHAVENVAVSIQKFGFASPIIAQLKTKRIIAGHTRFKAAKKLNLDFVPVRFMDLTDKEADALAIADNKIGELSQWDEKQLKELISDLQEDFDMNDLGFSDFDIEKLMEHTTDWDDFANEELEDSAEYDDNSMTAVTVFVENQYKVSATEVIKAALEEYGYEYSFRETKEE